MASKLLWRGLKNLGDLELTLRSPYTGPMNKKYQKPTASELKKNLTPLQFAVTQNDSTEPPFKNEYWNNKKDGLYVDVVTGEPLFSSLDKFDSGCGWPSFTKALDGKLIIENPDQKLGNLSSVLAGMTRTEVRSALGDSHLGHVFEDGPPPTGQRYCINSASLRFIPAHDLEKEGYGDFANLFKKSEREKATLAAGCFWGVEEIIREFPGVIETTVGYTGGTTANPIYKDICRGDTQHAEAIEVIFNPAILSYEDLLKLFFRLHDPTTLNRQADDMGTQYRSAIFCHSPEQVKIAEKVKAEINQSGKWPKPLVTEITEAQKFYPAEDCHQDYLKKNPDGYHCHYLRD